jgi:hypothetical protein
VDPVWSLIELPQVSGFFRAKRWMARMGTSIERIHDVDPEAIAIMELLSCFLKNIHFPFV